jgi:hypothetical protein
MGPTAVGATLDELLVMGSVFARREYFVQPENGGGDIQDGPHRSFQRSIQMWSFRF